MAQKLSRAGKSSSSSLHCKSDTGEFESVYILNFLLYRIEQNNYSLETLIYVAVCLALISKWKQLPTKSFVFILWINC